MCFTLGRYIQPPIWNQRRNLSFRLKYSRNRQRLPDLWGSLHRVCPTLPTETSSDSRLGCWMAEHPWTSRGYSFYRIRVSEHDMGSSLDRQGQFTRSL